MSWKRLSVSGAMLVLAVVMVPRPAFAAPAAYSASPRAGWTPNAAVNAITRVDGRVYLGGEFTSITNRATGETVAVSRLAALDAATGDLIRTWLPQANGTVHGLTGSADGTRVFAAGSFTSVTGQSRSRLVALNAASGAVIAGWSPYANAEVRTIARSGDTLYFGGAFGTVSGSTRTRLAAVSATSGALTAWAPSANGFVRSVKPTLDDSRVLIGGEFRNISGAARTFLASANAATGAVDAWNPPPGCADTGNPCYVFGVDTDGSRVFTAIGGPGGRASAYDLNTGARIWDRTGDGDSESIAYRDGMVYVGGHYAPLMAGDARFGLSAFDAGTGALDPYFAPQLNQTLGVRVIYSDADFLRVGGTWQQVNGQALPRYAEFPAIGAPADLIGSGQVWRYNDSGADLGTGWRATGFTDSSWPSGPSQLGFGDGGEATVIAGGRITYYFRTTFTVADPAAYRDLVLQFIRDDGAIVYLNGVEVMRSAMPGGTVTAATLASVTSGGADESFWHSRWIRPSMLRTGVNTLAVEVHQAAANSSDVSFDLRVSVR